RRLIDRQLGGKRGFFQRVGLLARLLGRHIGGDHILAALDQRLQHGLAERLLAVDDDTHSVSSSLSAVVPAKAGTTSSLHYAASAFAGFSGGVIAPEPLISAYSLAE